MTQDNTIPTHSFKVGEATITVRQETGFDLIDARLVWRKLVESKVIDAESERDKARAWEGFIPAATQTVSIEGDLGFPWVTVGSSAEDMGAAYLTYGKSVALASGFLIALNQVEKLTPGEEATSPEKKD